MLSVYLRVHTNKMSLVYTKFHLVVYQPYTQTKNNWATEMSWHHKVSRDFLYGHCENHSVEDKENSIALVPEHISFG